MHEECEDERDRWKGRALEAERKLDVAVDALRRHGYRESCDIPACNCGDQLTAESRLEGLLKYAQHETNCYALAWSKGSDDCTCGLKAFR